MEIVRQCPFNSGYQPRPVPPPSAGRALSVLIAVCAVLWVWWMTPEWLVGNRLLAGIRWLQEIRFHECSALLLGVGNTLVWRYTTWPIWISPRHGIKEESKRALVLLPSLLFHLLSILLLICLGLMAVLFSYSDGLFQD